MFVIIVTINLVKDYFLIGSFIMVKYFCFFFLSRINHDGYFVYMEVLTKRGSEEENNERKSVVGSSLLTD